MSAQEEVKQITDINAMSCILSRRVLFLSHESPWPAHNGGALRSLQFLHTLHKSFEVDLFLLTREPLSNEQSLYLGSLAERVTRLPLLDVSKSDKLRSLATIVRHGYPYHSAVIHMSLMSYPEEHRRILEYPGVIVTSNGHWGTLIQNRPSPNWVLNQTDADVEFWRVYASQTANPLARMAAQMNYVLASKHYPHTYANVGRIISVCEEDRQHTLVLAPHAQIDVIENGVDCSYYVPHRQERTGPLRLLFTGTSAARNMTALHNLVTNILHLIRAQLPDVELVVGGNFSAGAQAQFNGVPGMRFTGRIEDIRPVFDECDIFVAPFAETHGSKLKIAEAMAMSLPIVSTWQGVRGFPLTDGHTVLIANDYQEFAQHVLALSRDPDRRRSMGLAARQLALSTIDWSVLGKRLAQIVETTQEQTAQGQEYSR